MGIEDFNLDLEELADRVLVIGQDDNSMTEISNLLERRSYQWAAAKTNDEASELAKDELFDLIILENTDLEASPGQLVSKIRAFPRLRRAPLLLLHPAPEKYEEESNNPGSSDVLVLKSPYNPTNLLVKVATQLRLRKIRSEQASADAKITAQNAELRDLTNRYKHELVEARSIQQSILPKKLVKHDDCLFAAKYIPLEAVGGDLYDLWEIGDGKFGFFIGDVTGHGLPAAFIGAMTKLALEYADQSSPEKMLSHMNDGISNLMPTGRFVTVAAAVFDANTKKISFARGGHPPPFIYRAATGTVDQFEAKGLPLGIMTGSPYELVETEMFPGDKMLMITDGLPESADMNGNMLGVDGIAEFFREAARTMNIRDCIDELLRKRDEHVDGRMNKDDDTFVGVEILKG